MRAAPAVSLTASTGMPWRQALWAVLSLCAISVVAWAAARGDRASAAVAALCVVYLLGLAWRSRRPACWRLDWDGQGWSLQYPSAVPSRRGGVAVALDFGDALLLRFVPEAGRPGQTHWLPLSRADCPSEWHGLRCALYSPRAAESPPVP